MQAPRQILQGFNFLIPNGLLLKQAWLTTVIKVNLAMKRLLVQHILVAKKKNKNPNNPTSAPLAFPEVSWEEVPLTLTSQHSRGRKRNINLTLAAQHWEDAF